MFYDKILKIMKICCYITIIYIFLLGIYKLFSNSEFVWKTKFIIDILSESISLIIFFMLIILFLQKSEHVNNREGYIYQLEDSKDNSSSNNTRYHIDNSTI